MSGVETSLNWNYIDLDEVLAKITVDDLGSDFCDEKDSKTLGCSGDQETDTAAPERTVFYDCPVCSKALKSAGGLRGHVRTQHPELDCTSFRVSNYKRIVFLSTSTSSRSTESSYVCHVNPDPAHQSESFNCDKVPSTSAAAQLQMTRSDCRNFLTTACKQSWSLITNDPLFLLPQSKHGLAFRSYASQMIEHSDTIFRYSELVDSLFLMFCDRSLVSQGDRDALMRDVHLFRVSSTAVNNFTSYVSACIPNADVDICVLLFHVWLRKLISEILCKYIPTKSESDRDAVKSLTDIDQNILYYISGYMAMKLKDAGFRSSKLQKLETLNRCLATKDPQQFDHFVSQYRSWVTQQSRGGLLYPIPDFYLLVREFDAIFRQVVCSQTLESNIINQGQLKLLMSQSAIVKLHWEKILHISDTDEMSSLPALDYLMTLFITLKGFAVAKKEREQLREKLVKSNKSSLRPSKSLRGNLKMLK